MKCQKCEQQLEGYRTNKLVKTVVGELPDGSENIHEEIEEVMEYFCEDCLQPYWKRINHPIELK